MRRDSLDLRGRRDFWEAFRDRGRWINGGGKREYLALFFFFFFALFYESGIVKRGFSFQF
jgi:hypothetical protein